MLLCEPPAPWLLPGLLMFTLGHLRIRFDWIWTKWAHLACVEFLLKETRNALSLSSDLLSCLNPEIASVWLGGLYWKHLLPSVPEGSCSQPGVTATSQQRETKAQSPVSHNLHALSCFLFKSFELCSYSDLLNTPIGLLPSPSACTLVCRSSSFARRVGVRRDAHRLFQIPL